MRRQSDSCYTGRLVQIHAINMRGNMTILFDLDGTITDPALGITQSLNYAIKKMGQAERPLADLQQFIGPPLDQNFQKLLPHPTTAEIDQAIVFFRERYFTIGWQENTPYLAMPAILAMLQQSGHSLRICTTKPTHIAVRILQHFELAQHFDSIHGCEIGFSKTELIAQLLADGKCNEQSWMIGDRKSDIEAGKRNGLRTIGVTWGFGSQAELIEAMPTLLVSQPKRLLENEY